MPSFGLAEIHSPEIYARRLLGELYRSHSSFRAIEPDPDGFGSAAFNEVILALEERCADMGIDIADVLSTKRTPDPDWYELDRKLQDAKAIARSLIRSENILLLMDQIQIALFITLIRMHRERETMSDAEVAYYARELYELRSMALLGIPGIPRFLTAAMYRYFAGVSNVVSFLKASGDHDPASSTTDLPYTPIGFDYDVALQWHEDHKNDDSVVRVRSEGMEHGHILSSLGYIDSIATPEELTFLNVIFRDPATALLGRKNTILYHYMEVEFLAEDKKSLAGEPFLFGFAVRLNRKGELRVEGWNCGKAGEISDAIHELTLAVAFGAATTTAEVDGHVTDMLFRLSYLLRPDEDLEPEEGDQLVIITEGATSLFPFAALQLRYGTNLALRASIVMAPNLSRDLASEEGQAQFASVAVISVSENAPNGLLPALPEAAGEGDAVAGLWQGRHFKNDAADAETIANILEEHQLVHLATHGLVEGSLRHLDRASATTSPVEFLAEADAAMKASSLLAGGENADGSQQMLAGSDLAKLDLKQLELVFLSLCGGASARTVGGEAAFGLAHSLRRAGARNVIATIYPVSDAVAREVATRFHAHLAGGSPPAKALHMSQRSMAQDGYGWHCWGGYQLLS